MTVLVIFVEEPSARIVVADLTRRIAPDRRVIVVEHEGKTDLRSSFPRKIAAWRHPVDVPFIILQDNDGADCKKLKADLARLVPAACRKRTKVRIVMQNLEAWYLGDPIAMLNAGLVNAVAAERIKRQAKFKAPDRLINAKQEFLRLHDETGQLALAHRMAPHLDLDCNRSASFKMFVETTRALLMHRSGSAN